MLRNFFSLDNPEAVRRFDANELRLHFSNSSSLENADVGGEVIGGGNTREWKGIFTGRTFKNVRFSHAVFEKITFTNCVFEDCLLIGSQFVDCEFHRCKIINCNTYKFSLNNVYIDPKCVVLDGTYKSTASNVGVGLYHELYRNAVEARQESHARYADIRMERWKRAQLSFDLKEGKITKRQFHWRRLLNVISDVMLGYGYGWLNFLVVGLLVFGLLALLVQQTWEFVGLRISGALIAAPSYLDMLYYSLLLITTLGFAEAMPATTYGRLLAVAFALSGIIWAGILTSLLVKRLIR